MALVIYLVLQKLLTGVYVLALQGLELCGYSVFLLRRSMAKSIDWEILEIFR